MLVPQQKLKEKDRGAIELFIDAEYPRENVILAYNTAESCHRNNKLYKIKIYKSTFFKHKREAKVIKNPSF